MVQRRLSPEENALWKRVMAGVRPLPGRPARFILSPPVTAPALPRVTPVPQPAPRHAMAKPGSASRAVAGATLDGGWDRRLSRGLVSPDRTVDLHDHGLHSAYMTLDQALGQAISRGERLILLVTGKPPPRESERPHARGAIRAAVGDWLAASRHSDRIAAVRGAHPRHGGTGALYIVLRRPRQVS